MSSFEFQKFSNQNDLKPPSIQSKNLKKIANSIRSEEKTFLEKTQNSYDFSKTNIVNLQKYQKIFNESNLYQDFSTSSYVPKSLLTKTHFKNIKKTPFNSVTHINPFEKIVHDLTDHEILMKTQITKNLLTDDHQKTREKIKKNNDISFIYEGKETNRTIAKEISIIKDGLEANPSAQQKQSNFYEKMYNHDVGNRYEVSLSFLKDKMISPLEPLSTKLSSKLFTLSHLGYDEMPSSSLGPLTKTLKTSTKTQINFHTSQNKLLKNPNSRKDVEELDSWLKYMLSKQENEKNSADSIKNIFENTQIIYNACLKEIIRQISMDCSERGQFIQKIWDAYIALFERALIQNKRELEQKDLSSVEENSRIHKIYQYEIESLGNFIKSLSEEKEKLREQLASSRDRIKDLKRRLKTIQIDNRKLDNENEDIRKENEIALKTNLDLNFRIEQILNDNHSQDRSRTISPQNFQMKNTMFARKNPNNNNSPNKGPKEKISLFSDNGASVVGHLMYHKMGEIVNPMIKLENLQKVKDKFVEIDIEEPKLQSIFSMKQFMKHETLEKEKTLSDNKIPQEEQKNEVADLMSSEQSIVGREDKNVGTGNENFEQEFKEIGVNTENNSNGNFENNNEELQVVGLFIEDILKEIIQLSEEEKIEIKSKILKVIKLKAFSSAALSRKMTIFELENEDLKNKYRKLIIQCSEFELEKSLLAKQLKDQEKKFEEPFEWNTHFEDSNEPLTHHHPKKNMIFESFVKHFLKIDDENAYNIDENDLNRDEDDLNVEENNLTEDIKKKDSIIKANNELKKMQDHNARIEELQEESQESETSILKQKKARINSEGDIKEVKSKNDNKKRRNSEIIKKVRKSSFNIKKGKNIRKGNKKEDFNQSNQVTIEMKNNQNEINISNNNNEKQFSRNEKKNIIYKEQNERANNKKYFERTSDIQQQYRKDSLSANQEIINSHEKPHAERFSPNKETNSALQRIIFNNEINSSSYRKNKERIGFFNNEINSNSFIKSKEIGVVVNKEMKSKSYENPKAALAINKTNSEHYNSRMKKREETLTKFLKPILRSNMNRVYGINTDDANLVINYVNKLQVDQIRPLSIQNILKFICMLYQEKKKIGANSTTPLHIYLYDFFFSQVGLKKITEDKMKKFLSSCLFYQEKNERINVFCRLVGIKYHADPYDLTFYLSCMKFFEENKIEPVNIAYNYNPVVYVSYDDAITFLEKNYQFKILKETYQQVEALISEKKLIDPISMKTIIEFDFLMINILKIFSDQKEEKKRHLHDVFYSADLDQDEFIEIYEFLMLNRHIEKDKWSFVEVQKIFIKESDCIVPITNEKALSFRKFIDISIDYDLFSEEKTYKFIEGNEIEQNFLKILENINEKVQIFKLRFIKAKEYNYTNKRIIDNLELKFKGQNFEERDKKILLISYRLIEEESKRIILESEIDSLMPMEIREIRHIYEERILF